MEDKQTGRKREDMGTSADFDTKLEKPSIRLSKAITFTVQSRLLELPQCSERQLLAAGSLLSRRDYDDVVTERSLALLCGFPRCPNPLPTSRPGKGRYRISLRGHRVYDVQEANRFCSDNCCVSSNAFVATLEPGNARNDAGPTPSRIADILRLFDDGDDGITEEEEPEGKEDYSGVPLTDIVNSRLPQPSLQDQKKKKKPGQDMMTALKEDLRFSKLMIHEKSEAKEDSGEISMEEWLGPSNAIEGYVPQREKQQRRHGSSSLEKSMGSFSQFQTDIIVGDPMLDAPCKTESFSISCMDNVNLEAAMTSDDGNLAKEEVKIKERKSSLRKPGSRGRNRGIRWADKGEEEVEVLDAGGLGFEPKGSLPIMNDLDKERTSCLALGETCQSAPIQVSKAMSLGGYEVEDAATLLSSLDDVVETDSEDETAAFERSYLKWPRKPVLLDADVFHVEDSWHGAPPEGFKLTLSTFASMWKALFGWLTSSSMAYIYGKSGDSEDELLFVGGREYPQKVSLSDGRSSEIKRTLAGCVARALPQVVSELRLPIPISTIEKAMGCLLETLSFMEAIPPFKTKEWNVIVLLFLEALSVSRIPTLSSHMANKMVLLNKVIEAAHVRRDEYEAMKDLMIPLGRVPQFFVRSGA